VPTDIRIIAAQDLLRAAPDGTLDLDASGEILMDPTTTVETAGIYQVLIDTRAITVMGSQNLIFKCRHHTENSWRRMRTGSKATNDFPGPDLDRPDGPAFGYLCNGQCQIKHLSQRERQLKKIYETYPVFRNWAILKRWSPSCRRE
jgi:hypothetical protein